jgi:molybdopterin converting factor small subunit
VEVAVQVHGTLRDASLPRALALSLPETATAGDLLAQLGSRFGAPFAGAAAARDPRLPREIRLFVGGDLVLSREQRLAAYGAAAPVTVVLLTPVSGG